MQVELPEPSAARAVERAHVVDLGDREAEQVDAHGRAVRHEELVEAPFHRLLREQQLIGYQYDGFWASMDTFKDRQQLERLQAGSGAPW